MMDKENNINIFNNDPSITEQDKDVSEYQKLIREELCISNNLLGEFIDEKYIVSKAIKEELVLAKKYQVDSDETKIFAILRSKFEVIHLELVFSDFGEEKSAARFYLVETVREYEEDIKTFVAEYISEKRIDFRQKAREAFNIFLTDDEKEEDVEDLETIDKKLSELKKLQTQDMEFVTEMYAEIYVEKMLKILAKMGPKGQKILKEFKEGIEKKGLTDKAIPKIYTKLKRVLDKVIENNGGIKLLAKENPEIKKAIKEYTEPIKAYREIARQEPIIAAPQVAKEKSAGKSVKKPAAKKEEKKASSSGAKKAPAKKAGGAKAPAKKDDKSKKKGKPIVVPSKDLKPITLSSDKKKGAEKGKPAASKGAEKGKPGAQLDTNKGKPATTPSKVGGTSKPSSSKKDEKNPFKGPSNPFKTPDKPEKETIKPEKELDKPEKERINENEEDLAKMMTDIGGKIESNKKRQDYKVDDAVYNSAGDHETIEPNIEEIKDNLLSSEINADISNSLSKASIGDKTGTLTVLLSTERQV